MVLRGFSEAAGGVTVEKAGEGNMNCVLRVRMSKRSVIVKQARPWVEKYPTIAAPVQRAMAEARFYGLVSGVAELSRWMPRLLDFDDAAAVLVMEDLTPAEPLMACYDGTFVFDEAQLMALANFTRTLHHLVIPEQDRADFQNREMRKLNHEHIFDLPIRSEGSAGSEGAFREMLEGITPGLDEAGAFLREDDRYCEIVRQLGDRYLADRAGALIHGDLFPGSLMRRESGALCVIDPEFSFCGDPEFDLGVFYAHLLLSRHPEARAEIWLRAAQDGGGRDELLLLQYAGVEIMRRLLGVAQLPGQLTLEEKRRLLERSRELVLGGA